MRKELRIYLPFAANELKRQLAYKGAFYLADTERNGGLCLYGLRHGVYCHGINFNDRQ